MGYDLFISYHSPDREAIHTVRELLGARGITSFLDREHLVAGLPWPQALEEALQHVSGVVVFLGAHGLGSWQKREIGFALDRQVQEEQAARAFPVIPVLLPGADPMPGFLFLNTWVDLRDDLADPKALEALVRALGGEQAGPVETALLCPYRGLQVFREEHAAFFCGREAFAERLMEATLSRNLVVLVGPSGSGKSSVAQAGLLPRLRRQRPPSATWDAAIFTPGEEPFHRLAGALLPLLEADLSETDRLAEARKLGDRLAGGEVCLEDIVNRLLEKSAGTDRLLLLADQFEELFTTAPEPAREPFVAALLRARERSPLTLTLTLRADFYGNALSLSRDLSDALEQGVINLGSMRREELERAIVAPTHKVGLAFETGLVPRILDDVAKQPGHLPLLEFALTELWARRQGGQLTHDAYQAIGGVKGALSQRAEAIFKGFAKEQQGTVRQVFTHLVRVTRPDEGSEDTRKRAALTELGEYAGPVVDRLVEERLLVTGGEASVVTTLDPSTPAVPDTPDREATPAADGAIVIELAHEALIRGWDRLRVWLSEDREFLLWRQRLQPTVDNWERTERDEGTLLRGALLAEAERWLNQRPGDLAPRERDFLQASREREEREAAARQRAQQKKVWGLIAVVGIVLIFAIISGWQWQQAEQQRHVVEGQRKIALARQLGAQALQIAQAPNAINGGQDRAVLLAAQAIRVRDSAESWGYLLRAIQTNPRLETTLWGHKGKVSSVAISHDGTILASAGYDGTVRLWDPATGTLLREPLEGHTDVVFSVAFSPDGTILASASGDSTVRLWDPATGTPLGEPLRGHQSWVASVAFSPDGKFLASAGYDGTVRLWDPATATPLGEPLQGHANMVTSVAFSPDGKFLASAGDDTVRLWDPATGTPLGEPLQGYTNAVSSVAFSPDSTILASANLDGTLHLWDPATGALLGEPLQGHAYSVISVAFSPDGKRLASAGEDGTVRLWDPATGTLLGEPLRGHAGWISSLAYSPNGKFLASTGHDGTVRLWDPATGNPLRELEGHTNQVLSVAFSHDGKFLASAGNDVRLWDPSTGTLLGEPLEGGVFSIAFSPDGKFLASASEDGTVILWDLDLQARACRIAGRNLTLDEWRRYLGEEERYEPTCPNWPSGAPHPETASPE